MFRALEARRREGAVDSDHQPVGHAAEPASRFDRKPDDGRFIVVSDIYPTPTTAMADLILPAAAWVEREGVFGNTERRTQQWNKMVDPPGEAREDAWQVIQVAKRMGMGHLFPWPDDNWHEPMFEEYRSVRRSGTARTWRATSS